jgi:hypothetical protein
MPLTFPENGVIRLYNQFPRRYRGGLQAMCDDLPRIAALGFNVVWINPIQLTGDRLKPLNREETSWGKGSLYAMAHDEQFNPDFFPEGNTAKQIELLKSYVQKAKELGLIPIFDLVLNHVGRGQNNQTHLEQKFNKFLRSDNNNDRWPDTAYFNYETAENREYLIKNLWEPLIRAYIETYGFMGVRVDAITNVHPDLQKSVYAIIRECCNRAHRTPPIIVGELMSMDPLEDINTLAPLGFSHIFACGVFYNNFFHGFPDENHWLTQQTLGLQKIIWHSTEKTSESNQQGMGGVVAFVGNHDVGTHKATTLYHANMLQKDGRIIKFRERDNRALKTVKYMNVEEFEFSNQINFMEKLQERIFRIAFSGNAGWYLLAGDEFEIPHRPHVFDYYKEKMPIEDIRTKQDSTILEKTIIQINIVLSQMPQTSLGDKATHQSIEVQGKKIPIIIHASNRDRSTRVICLNLDFSLDANLIARTLYSNIPDNPESPLSKIFILGHHLLIVQKQEFTCRLNIQKDQNNTTDSASTSGNLIAAFRH